MNRPVSGGRVISQVPGKVISNPQVPGRVITNPQITSGGRIQIQGSTPVRTQTQGRIPISTQVQSPVQNRQQSRITGNTQTQVNIPRRTISQGSSNPRRTIPQAYVPGRTVSQPSRTSQGSRQNVRPSGSRFQLSHRYGQRGSLPRTRAHGVCRYHGYYPVACCSGWRRIVNPSKPWTYSCERKYRKSDNFVIQNYVYTVLFSLSSDLLRRIISFLLFNNANSLS